MNLVVGSLAILFAGGIGVALWAVFAYNLYALSAIACFIGLPLGCALLSGAVILYVKACCGWEEDNNEQTNLL
jgi:hypothetical protein